jgi:hypothetical protein
VCIRLHLPSFVVEHRPDSAAAHKFAVGMLAIALVTSNSNRFTYQGPFAFAATYSSSGFTHP